MIRFLTEWNMLQFILLIILTSYVPHAVYCSKYRVLYVLCLQFYAIGHTRVCMTSLELGNTNEGNMHLSNLRLYSICKTSQYILWRGDQAVLCWRADTDSGVISLHTNFRYSSIWCPIDMSYHGCCRNCVVFDFALFWDCFIVRITKVASLSS